MSGQIQMDGMFHLFLTLPLPFFYTIKQLTLKSQISENKNIKMLKYIYKQIY